MSVKNIQNKKRGSISSINRSQTKGTTKKSLEEARLVEDFGLEGDAHGGPGLRQVSFLAAESIERQMSSSAAKTQKGPLNPGDFAENITTENLDLLQLKIGDQLKIGSEAIVEISKIGKECHRHCAVYYKTGDCIMPREGIFAKVLKGGSIRRGDAIEGVDD